MKRGICALTAFLLLLFALAAQAESVPQAEDVPLTVYVAQGAMPSETAQQLTALVARALGLAEVTLIEEAETGLTLRDLVLQDRAPQIALCAPESAALWAKEGLLAPVEGCVADSKRMQQQVLDACSLEGELFMAPLTARHRTVAVNRRMLEKEHFSELMDARTHPVWYPLEIQQVLEAFAVDGSPAVEIWPVEPATAAAIEALVQAFYGGAFLSEDGQICLADSSAAVAGVAWLQDMVGSGQIGWAESREDALERFLSGETALFIDWTDEDERANRMRMAQSGLDMMTMPYPSATGIPVRSFEVTGAAVFVTGDTRLDALALQAVAFLSEDAQAQLILGDRAIWADDAIWLPSVRTHPQDAVLRTALCSALDAALRGGQRAEAAMRSVISALEAAR